jgi:hypothetical protein
MYWMLVRNYKSLGKGQIDWTLLKLMIKWTFILQNMAAPGMNKET